MKISDPKMASLVNAYMISFRECLSHALDSIRENRIAIESPRENLMGYGKTGETIATMFDGNICEIPDNMLISFKGSSKEIVEVAEYGAAGGLKTALRVIYDSEKQQVIIESIKNRLEKIGLDFSGVLRKAMSGFTSVVADSAAGFYLSFIEKGIPSDKKSHVSVKAAAIACSIFVSILAVGEPAFGVSVFGININNQTREKIATLEEKFEETAEASSIQGYKKLVADTAKDTGVDTTMYETWIKAAENDIVTITGNESMKTLESKIIEKTEHWTKGEGELPQREEVQSLAKDMSILAIKKAPSIDNKMSIALGNALLAAIMFGVRDDIIPIVSKIESTGDNPQKILEKTMTFDHIRKMIDIASNKNSIEYKTNISDKLFSMIQQIQHYR